MSNKVANCNCCTQLEDKMARMSMDMQQMLAAVNQAYARQAADMNSMLKRLILMEKISKGNRLPCMRCRLRVPSTMMFNDNCRLPLVVQGVCRRLAEARRSARDQAKRRGQAASPSVNSHAACRRDSQESCSILLRWYTIKGDDRVMNCEHRAPRCGMQHPL